MNLLSRPLRAATPAALLLAFALLASLAVAETNQPQRTGATLYVSKLGDNSDGRSWKTAFNTIQKALDAVPDSQGAHTIRVRPDRYVEANLAPSHPGAKGAYNTLIGDFDGHLDSGASGWVLIDSGDPKKGFKSWDWWSTIRASSKDWDTGNNRRTTSCINWDRWTLRRLYASGGDAGFFFDESDHTGEPFTVVLEDCVGIGRAFGGGVAHPTARPGEPSVFRRCHLMALDWVGDTAAVLIGGWEQSMPKDPLVVFEDCTLVHPDNAVGLGYSSRCARAKFIRCRLLALNFGQPEMGVHSTGIICTLGHATNGRLHVDLQDCYLAGFCVFTPGQDIKALSYTVEGTNLAYIQFTQELPAGFQRVGLWPADWFAHIAPPAFEDASGARAPGAPQPRPENP